MSSSKTTTPTRLIAIGNFDGVHRGHQQVLLRAVKLAQELQVQATIVTFSPHPAEVLRGQAPPLLTRLEDKLSLLRALPGAPDVVVLPFDRALAALSPAEFIDQVVLDQLDARAVLVGANFRFGRGRAGDLKLLESFGAQRGFQAEAFALAEFAGKPFSSTRIREALRVGELELAREMLGRPHALRGKVVAGDGRGRQIGFPTANLAGVLELLPPAGVYAVAVTLLKNRNGIEAAAHDSRALASKKWAGVLHLGARPTVDRPESVEVHLFDFEQDLYGVELRVELLGALRGVERFESVEALKEQISKDIVKARSLIQADGLA